MPSLFQFLADDAASVVDYSKDSGFEDGVVNNLPPKVVVYHQGIARVRQGRASERG
jgi:hypothetical protein